MALGVIGAFGILSCIFAVVSIFVFIGTMFDSDYHKYRLTWGIVALIFLFIGPSLLITVASREQQYYLQYGAPYTVYGRVQGVSGDKITIDDGIHATNTYKLSGQKLPPNTDINDLVRITYADGFFRNFVLQIQKMVPEGK